LPCTRLIPRVSEPPSSAPPLTSFSFAAIAILQAQESQLIDQVSFRIRGYLIYRIHVRSLFPVDHRVIGANESAKVTVLANIDVGNVTSVFRVFFEVVTCAITVAVGAYLLFQVAGIAFLDPLFLCFLSAAVPFALSPKLPRTQKAGLEATEKRLRSMSLLVSNMRSVRLGGLQWFAADEARASRQLEITAAALYRKILIMVVCAGECIFVISLSLETLVRLS